MAPYDRLITMNASRKWPHALRWFAAEFSVVVTGVLVALAVQALYQRSSDRARERAYLRQLKSELIATEQLMDTGDSISREPDHAGVMVVRAYRTHPPRDSILLWLGALGRSFSALPIVGTAEALVASGDLSLVEDDSLRFAIADYVARNRSSAQLMQSALQHWNEMRTQLSYIVDLNEGVVANPDLANPRMRDTLYSPLPHATSPRIFPIDTDALLRNRVAYAALDRMNWAKYVCWLARDRMRQSARELRRRVEGVLNERG
jgi:hypothetical protein